MTLIERWLTEVMHGIKDTSGSSKVSGKSVEESQSRESSKSEVEKGFEVGHSEHDRNGAGIHATVWVPASLAAWLSSKTFTIGIHDTP